MAAFLDMVAQKVTSQGTGPAVLGEALSGFRTMARAGAVDGVTYSFIITDGMGSEIAEGVYNAATQTITRIVSDTIIVGTTSTGGLTGGEAPDQPGTGLYNPSNTPLSLSGQAVLKIVPHAADLTTVAEAISLLQQAVEAAEGKPSIDGIVAQGHLAVFTEGGNLGDGGELGALANLDAVATTHIDNDAVTLAKLQNIATDKVLGRSTASTGDVELLDCTAAGRAVMGAANNAAQRTAMDVPKNGWTQIGSNVTASGAEVAFSDIPQTYAELMVVFTGLSAVGASATLALKISTNANGSSPTSAVTFGPAITSASDTVSGSVRITGYSLDVSDVSAKALVNPTSPSVASASGGVTVSEGIHTGGLKWLALLFTSSATDFDAGTIKLFAR